MRLVILPKDLRRLLCDTKSKANVLLVDTRPFSDYINGHIPGAVNLDLMQFHWVDTSARGIEQFNRQMKLLISYLGVAEDKLIVFYDHISGPSAARGVWLLLYFSHEKAALLDGGFLGWCNIRGSIETKSNAFTHCKSNNQPNVKILADFRTVKSAINKQDSVAIIDTRSESEYTGSVVRAARAGHIPSAINIDWKNNLESNGTFKDDRKLRSIYSTIKKNDEIIVYCQGGYRAANTFVVLKTMGYKHVRMYLGSWGEWGNRLELPTAS
jgi:thiosulfate/3-mercaptopyruvate sulfurtransferase